MASTRARFIAGEDGHHDASLAQQADDDRRPSRIQRRAAPVAADPDPFDGDGEKEASPRWTTINQFVHSGFLYQLRRRPVESPGDHARLSEREELVVAQVVAGHSNKTIACNLGVAPSTVGVLLFRAAAKLGVRSRTELNAAYARRTKTPKTSA